MNNEKQLDFFFWLGTDGELVSVTEDELEDRQQDVRKNLDDWLNAAPAK